MIYQQSLCFFDVGDNPKKDWGFQHFFWVSLPFEVLWQTPALHWRKECYIIGDIAIAPPICCPHHCRYDGHYHYTSGSNFSHLRLTINHHKSWVIVYHHKHQCDCHGPQELTMESVVVSRMPHVLVSQQMSLKSSGVDFWTHCRCGAGFCQWR